MGHNVSVMNLNDQLNLLWKADQSAKTGNNTVNG